MTEEPLAFKPAGLKSIPMCDERIAAFVRLVHAVDQADAKAGIAATRELRKCGFSVCLTGSTGGKAVAR